MRTELLYSKLKELENSLFYIKEFIPSDFEYLKTRKDKNALYKEVEYSIQLIIDICAIINSDIVKKTPLDEEGIIDSLKDKKIISKEVSESVKGMKRFRNVLVHKYDDIDDKIAYESIKRGLKDINAFINEIGKFLEKMKFLDRYKLIRV